MVQARATSSLVTFVLTLGCSSGGGDLQGPEPAVDAHSDHRDAELGFRISAPRGCVLERAATERVFIDRAEFPATVLHCTHDSGTLTITALHREPRPEQIEQHLRAADPSGQAEILATELEPHRMLSVSYDLGGPHGRRWWIAAGELRFFGDLVYDGADAPEQTWHFASMQVGSLWRRESNGACSVALAPELAADIVGAFASERGWTLRAPTETRDDPWPQRSMQFNGPRYGVDVTLTLPGSPDAIDAAVRATMFDYRSQPPRDRQTRSDAADLVGLGEQAAALTSTAVVRTVVAPEDGIADRRQDRHFTQLMFVRCGVVVEMAVGAQDQPSVALARELDQQLGRVACCSG